MILFIVLILVFFVIKKNKHNKINSDEDIDEFEELVIAEELLEGDDND